MNSQKHQIQTLIAEIDVLLQSAGPRWRWFAAKPAAQQRLTLERLRQYLVQQQTLVAEGRSAANPRDRPPQSGASAASAPMTEAQQQLQGLAQEVRGLRASVLQPLRAEVITLMHQRDALQTEVQQLQASRPALEVASPQLNQQMINEFLQVLMARLQENLAQQVVQVLENHVTQLPITPAPTGMALPENWDAPVQRSTQQLQQLQQLHDRTDQVLGHLDTTLSVVFDSLQRNIQTYQDSLVQGVDQMHNLGQQGEELLANLVQQINQQLPQPSAPPVITAAATLTTTPTTAALDGVSSPLPGLEPSPMCDRLPVSLATPHLTISGLQPAPVIALPYPGTELPLSPPAVSETKDETEIAPKTVSVAKTAAAIVVSPADEMAVAPRSTEHSAAPLVAVDEINSLTDLLQQLAHPTETAPIVEAIAPPDVAAKLLLTPEFGGAAPNLVVSEVPAPSSAETAYTIFSLEGMDDLFLDPVSNAPPR